jgi:hypothetical protein
MKIFLLSDRPLQIGAPASLGPHQGTLVIHPERRLAEFSGQALCEEAEEATSALRSDFWRFLLRYRALLPLLGHVRALCERCALPRPLGIFGVDGVCFACAPVRVADCPACAKKVHADRLVMALGKAIACAWCEEIKIRPGIQMGTLNEQPIKRRRGRPRTNF